MSWSSWKQDKGIPVPIPEKELVLWRSLMTPMTPLTIVDGPSKRSIQLALFECELLKNAWVDFKTECGDVWTAVINGAERGEESGKMDRDCGTSWVLTGYAGLVGRNSLNQLTVGTTRDVKIAYETNQRKGIIH